MVGEREGAVLQQRRFPRVSFVSLAMERKADSLSLSTILSGNDRGRERREIRVRRPKTVRRWSEERRKRPRDKKDPIVRRLGDIKCILGRHFSHGLNKGCCLLAVEHNEI